MAITRNGKFILAAGESKVIRVFDRETFTKIRTILAHERAITMLRCLVHKPFVLSSS